MDRDELFEQLLQAENADEMTRILLDAAGLPPDAAEQPRRFETPPEPSGYNYLFDDTTRKWRPDAHEYMTDWEYVDWYEGYYYDPDNPY